MHLFLPKQFFINNNLEISASTYLHPGRQFHSNEGFWISYQTHSSNYEKLIHWFHILYANKNKVSAKNYTNAIIFHENNKIIFEVTREVEKGCVIRAKFHPDITIEEFVPSIQSENDDEFNLNEPLDLSMKKCSFKQTKNLMKKKHMLPCHICRKQFDRPSLLKRHIRTHTGERPHICEICGKGFSTSSSLNTHKRIHSGERPHQCKICGKRFTASSNLYYHRLTHSTEKPHKCDMCGKSFPTPGNLRSHKYSHEKSSPYKCNVCFRIFTKLSNLKNHRTLQKHI